MRPDCSDCLGICLAAPGPVFPHYFWACLHGKTKCWKTHQTAKERKKTLLLPCRATSRRCASAGPRAELISLGCLANQGKNFVEISETVSSNHVKVIETIAEQLAVGGCTKMMPWTSESNCWMSTQWEGLHEKEKLCVRNACFVWRGAHCSDNNCVACSMGRGPERVPLT